MEKALFNGVLIEEYIDVHNFSEDIVAVELKIDLPIEKVTVLKHGTYFYSHSNDTLYKGNFTLDENEENQSFLELEPLVFNGIKTSMAILLHNLYDYLPCSKIKYEFGKFLGIKQNNNHSLSEIRDDKIEKIAIWNSNIVHKIAQKKVDAQIEDQPNVFTEIFTGNRQGAGYKLYDNISLIYNIDSKDLLFSSRIEDFDLIVMCVIDNLIYYFKNDNKELRFSARQIACQLCGGSKPSKTLIDDVEKSLQKIFFVFVLVDTTKEFKNKNKVSANDHSWQGKVLKLFNFEIDLDANYKGNIKTEYVFKEHSVLYEYQENSNRLISVRSSYFKTYSAAKNINNTKTSITMKFYLIYRIQNMKYWAEKNHKHKDVNDDEYSNRIKLDTLYNHCSIPTPTERIENGIEERSKNGDALDKNKLTQIRKAAQVDRRYIEKILDYFIDMGWITSYKEVKENKKIVGYDIDYNENKEKIKQIAELY